MADLADVNHRFPSLVRRTNMIIVSSIRTTREWLLLGAAALAMATPGAQAQLTPHGSLGAPAANGYPSFVSDGVSSVDLPKDPATGTLVGDGLTAPTLIFDAVLPGNSVSVNAGFGTEAFFYLCNSNATQTDGSRALLVLGVEAAYGSGEPDPAFNYDQMIFARVRVSFTPSAEGLYTVTHPWGVEKIDVTAADAGARLVYTTDWGGFAAVPGTPVVQSFDRILYSPKKWSFMKATAFAPGVDTTAWLGDGVTVSTITPGINGNVFRIQGPSVSATDPGPTIVNTDQFTVSAHVLGGATPPPPPPGQITDVVTITLARFRNNAVDVRATSANALPLTATFKLANGTVVGSGALGANGRANIRVSTRPATVTVTSSAVPTRPNVLPGTATAPVN
jgi:hypothetical protein